MKKMPQPVFDILKALIEGREIVEFKNGYSLRWKDGIRSPSLANDITAPMMQCALIEQQGKNRIITLGGRLNYQNELKKMGK